jgi:uncharacterized repeat protein (TIGR03806 family)
MRLTIIFISLSILACKPNGEVDTTFDNKGSFVLDTLSIKSYGMGNKRLSEYGFFEGNIADLNPTEQVFPYELNSALFTDYADKARFISLPMGGTINYNENEVLGFPKGTILIKNFHYPQEDGSRRIIETRLLIHEPYGWKPITYIWNEEQTEAYFYMLGADIPVKFVDSSGEVISTNYGVPDLNQCKNCHMQSKGTMPIGPSARQLNRMALIDGKELNQLEYLSPFITGMPDINKIDALPDYMDATHSLDDRARAYLDINCGNCHRPEGSAKTSGLNLNYFETDQYKLGVNKSPIAAGKASGDRLYDIVPGSPAESILVYRMESTEAEVMMPEMGRKLVHKEGVELIKSWIKSM